ncbi:MAG: twin-arginine translocase subunit TatB [Alteromonadaceae bacterium]|nr:twin-arginine translocase subunit TatB [Alteromonadaceae bacterium]MBH87222.1 twin-arginine translocase subunit TatB [Alteromonadaceae bacterium]|tara:strand:+ start:1255 stop:1647 length:393 start_codon:yes stop_codon:yes gene_type:complete
MFDIGFLEVLICGVIALLVLGPERLPGAARTAGHWVGRARRMMRQFTSELDRQIKAEDLKEQLRKEGGIDLEGVQDNVRKGLAEARSYEHLIMPQDKGTSSVSPEPSDPHHADAQTPADTPTESTPDARK